jgi:hypothetical protein
MTRSSGQAHEDDLALSGARGGRRGYQSVAALMAAGARVRAS